VDLAGTQTINGTKTFSASSLTIGSSTGTGTINVGSGATISASTKTVNVGTGGVVGSTTLTTIGPVLGASTTSIGGTTAASTLNLATGATLTATTKAVNIGTAGVAGSTTNITIGSTTGTSTTTLQGITNGVTEAVDTNNTELATTAFVVGQASSTPPAATGTAAVGTSLRYARADHVHANPLPTGGTTGQVLSKVDGTNYNTTWTTVSGSTFTGGPVTSAITTDNGSGKVGYFGQTLIGYEDDPTGGSYVNKRSYITEDDLYVAKTIAEYGINYTSYSRYRFNGFQAIYNDSSVSSSTFNVGYSTNGVISYTAVTMSGNYDYTLSADGFTFKSPSMAAFFNISSSGITFPNGTTQTSAGMSPPAYTNAIWYGGVWYSANVNSVTDGYGNYYNVLTI
jgi:hypothetical protein